MMGEHSLGGAGASRRRAESDMTQQLRNDLVLAAQLGDSAALDRLLLVSATDARRYARRHCQPSDIEDAVQEALLIIARKLSALKAAAAFSGWLFTIVKRECDRMARAMLNHENIEDAKVEVYLATRDDVELRLELAAALESLPAHYRRIILMRDFEEMTISEIAAALGEPAGAVKSRLHRARELVREYLLGPPAEAASVPRGRR